MFGETTISYVKVWNDPIDSQPINKCLELKQLFIKLWMIVWGVPEIQMKFQETTNSGHSQLSSDQFTLVMNAV